MKTRPINSWYLKMNLTLVILMMFLITVIFVKQVSDQKGGQGKNYDSHLPTIIYKSKIQ